MFNKILLASVFFVLNLLFTKNITLASNFITEATTEYKIKETGIASVTNTFTIKNVSSNFQAEKFVFTLKGIEPVNIKAYEKGELQPIDIQKLDEGISVSVNFKNPVVGQDKSRTFIIVYEDSKIANKSGEIWEISVPKLEKNQVFDSYRAILSVPLSFGDEAYLYPQPYEVKESGDRRLYTYELNQLLERGITAGFGKSQIFSFTLSYHLENTSSKNSEEEIAIPPDTSLQRVFYQEISPEPTKIRIDKDGNWLAAYSLKPGQRIDVNVLGSVQIFASPRKVETPSEEVLMENTKASEFWQTEDPRIKELAVTLNTPKNIYDYVVTYLTYDVNRIKPDVVRFGAKSALASPNTAICMEFTDLFIAIARAAGIPAREINGYAHTDNTEIKPLSLVADILHAWPEYWDKEAKVWVPVDPTWGKTSGVDYFSKLDLRHFTFVIHGTSATKPYSPGSFKLGSNPQKDVFVTFGTLPDERYTNILVDGKIAFGLINKKLNVTFINQGIKAEYENSFEIFFDDKLQTKSGLPVLPPFSRYQTSIEIPYGLFASDAPETITIKSGGSTVTIPTNKFAVIVSQLTVLIIILLFIISLFFLKTHNLKFHKMINIFLNKIKNAKPFRKTQ